MHVKCNFLTGTLDNPTELLRQYDSVSDMQDDMLDIGYDNILGIQLTGTIDTLPFGVNDGDHFTNLTHLDISKLKFSEDADTFGTFSGINSIIAPGVPDKTISILGIENLNTENITDFSEAFKNVHGLAAIDISGWDMSSATDTSEMFSGCTNLSQIFANPAIDLSGVTSSNNMFYNCTSLPHFDDTKVDKTNANTSSTGYFYSRAGKAFIQMYSNINGITRKAFPYIAAATEENLGGVRIWTGTQDEYDDIAVTDPDTLYLVEDEGGGPTPTPTDIDAEDVSYDNDDHADVVNVQEALDKLFSKVYYVNPSCSLSASPSGGTFEIGSTISGVNFTWTVNKAIVSQTLTDCTIDVDDRSASYGSNISTNKTFTLTVNDGEKTASSSVSYSFAPKVYYGADELPDDYTAAWIKTLGSSALKSSKAGTYNFNIGVDEYGFIAMPKSFANTDKLIAKIGGFDTEIPRVETLAFTNDQGYTQDYNIFKTTNSNLGSISAVIS